MRAGFVFIIVTLSGLIAASPVFAGTLNLVDGRADWHSTRCVEPVEPQSLMAMSANAPADHLNELIMQFNAYAKQQQDYMDCVSNEAQTDADGTSQAITISAQAIIAAVQEKVTSLGDLLRPRQR